MYDPATSTRDPFTAAECDALIRCWLRELFPDPIDRAAYYQLAEVPTSDGGRLVAAVTFCLDGVGFVVVGAIHQTMCLYELGGGCCLLSLGTRQLTGDLLISRDALAFVGERMVERSHVDADPNASPMEQVRACLLPWRTVPPTYEDGTHA